MTDPAAGVVITFDDDQTVRTFTFDHSSSIGLSGSSFVDYTVEVTGNVGVVQSVLASASFELKLKNPCIEASLVEIQSLPLNDASYILFE